MTPASLKGQLRGRAGISAGLLALLASTFLCFGVTLRATDAIPLGSPVFWLAALALAAALWVAFLALGGGLRSLVAADPVGRRMRERAEGLRGRTRVVLAAGGACCALCWVVALLAAWPGYFCYDTGEIRSFVLAGTLSDAQSVLHELFAGGVIRGALAATGSWNASIATFVVVQAAIELAALLYALDRMARWGASDVVLALCWLYFSLDPFVLMLGLCTTKDTLFATWVLLLVVECCSLWLGPRRTQPAVSALAIAALSFLAGAYRSNGRIVVALLGAVVVLALVVRRAGGRRAAPRRPGGLGVLAVGLVAGILAGALWSGPAARVLEVEHRNPVREMISVPTANLAYLASRGVCVDLPEELSDLDLGLLGMGWDQCYQNSDVYRPYAWEVVESGRGRALLRYWLGVAREYPAAAATSTLMLTRCAWDPTFEAASYQATWYRNVPDFAYGETDTSVFACWVEGPGVQQTKVPWLADLFWRISRYRNYGGMPWLALLGSPAALNWILLGCLAFSVADKNPLGATVSLSLLAVVGTLLLGPTTLVRYYAFLVFCLPFVLFLALRGRACLEAAA
ncbi:DUF6020 family protein [Atopobiaceae bacterium HCP3S3_F7]